MFVICLPPPKTYDVDRDVFLVTAVSQAPGTVASTYWVLKYLLDEWILNYNTIKSPSTVSLFCFLCFFLKKK